MIRDLKTTQLTKKVVFKYKRDRNSYISTLFLVDIQSIEYLNQYPNILLLDCTYKTNKFDIPLVDVLRVNNIGRSFLVAFVFLNSKVKDNYLKVVYKLSSLYKEGVFLLIISIDYKLTLIKALNVTFLII